MIKTSLYIKLDNTAFEENLNSEWENKKYIWKCNFTLFADKEKTINIASRFIEFNDLDLEELTLTWIYLRISQMFQNPEFI